MREKRIKEIFDYTRQLKEWVLKRGKVEGEGVRMTARRWMYKRGKTMIALSKTKKYISMLYADKGEKKAMWEAWRREWWKRWRAGKGLKEGWGKRKRKPRNEKAEKWERVEEKNKNKR